MTKHNRQPLGPLEYEVMAILWALEAGTVRAVHQQILTKRSLAYTTIMTTMTRMAGKGLLEQTGEKARGFHYRPILTRAEFLQAGFARLEKKVDAVVIERQQVTMAMIRLWEKLDAATKELQSLRVMLGE